MSTRTVFVTREIPQRNVYGHLGYMHAIIEFLSRSGHDITVLLTTRDEPRRPRNLANGYLPKSTRLVGRGLLSAFGWYWSPPIPGLARRLAARISRDPALRTGVQFDEILGGGFPTGAQVAYASRKLDGLQPDWIFFDTVFLAPIADRVAARARKAVVTHDVFHQRREELVRSGYRVGPKGFDRKIEEDLLSRFDVIVAIQDQEARLLKEMAPTRAIVTVPMPILARPRSGGAQVPGRCIFVGSDAVANADGLRWFAGKVWPAVMSAVPEAELHVYGRVCSLVPEQVGRGIIMHGYTADLTPAYGAASVAIAPLRVGSGLKVKLSEYLAFGLPCVTTPAGAAGFRRVTDVPFAIAGDEAEFAHTLILLLRDEHRRTQLERNATSYCQLYGSDTVFQDLARVIV